MCLGDVHEYWSATYEQWSDWRWQLRNAVRSPDALCSCVGELLGLQMDSAVADKAAAGFGMKLTPHVLDNMLQARKANDEAGLNALLRMFVPSADELAAPTEVIDGIGEEEDHAKPAQLIANFYHERVLMFATPVCAAHCRYCFRRRKVGKRACEDDAAPSLREAWQEAIEYVREDTRVREVIVSGGDPLTLPDKQLFDILHKLKQIEHVEVLRLDTKVLTVLPQRITPELIEQLAALQPIYVVGNFAHAVELTPDTLRACAALVDSGIPVAAHTPLLRGINDDVNTMRDLMWSLFKNRILPYYLIQFIPTKWTEHFRVPVEKGMEIMKALYGHMSGLANPTYIVYLPHGKGKVPVQPDYLVSHADEGYVLRNFLGDEVLYREPSGFADTYYSRNKSSST